MLQILFSIVAHMKLVVPSKMNPVSEGDNQFGALFDKMPAKRIGRTEDIAGVILYLCSEAGVSLKCFVNLMCADHPSNRPMLTEDVYAWTEEERCSPMVNRKPR